MATSSLFAEFCKIINIPNAARILQQTDAFSFLNKFYIPAFYKAVPYNNIEAFNPDSRSNFYKGWGGFCRGGNTFAEKTDDIIDSYMKKRGGVCFQRCLFSHLVLKDGGIDNYLGGALIRTKPTTPHSLLFFKNLKGGNSLHMAELGNRIAPVFNLVDLDIGKEGELDSSPITVSKIVRTDHEKDPGKLEFQQLSRKKREPDALFKYYFDFDTREFPTLTPDQSECHISFVEPDNTPCKDFDETFQDQLIGRVWMIVGMDPAGCFVEYLNNAYRRYHDDGQLAAQKFFMNKKSMLAQILKDFPQFEEKFTSRCLDAAITLDRTKSPKSSMWPNFS